MESALYFVRWYYTTAIIDGIFTAGNYCWNILRVFSVRALVRTLFSPYKRIRDDVPSVFVDSSGFFEAIIGNLVTRAIGFVMRICVIFFAVAAFFSVIVVSAALLVVWILLPFVFPYIIMQSISHV